MWLCHYCRCPLSLEIQQKNRLCPNCGSDIHCCRNCRSFDENLSSKCREPESPWVSDRSAQNTCHFFEMASQSSPSSQENNEAQTEAEKAKKAFRDLFRQA